MTAWQPYLRAALPKPDGADRQRLEALAGHPLPDAWWRLVQDHGGDSPDDPGLGPDGEEPLHLGVLLLAVAPDRAGRHASYCIEDCRRHMAGRYPAGLFPFADDTGGNYWAFDLRKRPHDPAVVFIDHEEDGEDGISLAAESFAAFLAMLPPG